MRRRVGSRNDPSIHPGAPDLPDLAFVDSNCDGIDGTDTRTIFVAPVGKNSNPGTKTEPKREIQAGIAAAAGSSRDHASRSPPATAPPVQRARTGSRA